MALCSFCKNKIEQGTGMEVVNKTGRSYLFCSSKCRKNLLKLKRNPIHVKWSKFYEK